jgi:predicted nucleic acid-binding protein
MVISCDTSFLFSVYGNDVNTSRAHEHLKQTQAPIVVSGYNGFELENALRLAEFRKLIATGDSERFISQYRQDIDDGRIVEHPCNLAETLKKARQLSARHTVERGHRGFDILHVAAALEMGASEFLTFDHNQSRLAQVVNLKTPLQA